MTVNYTVYYTVTYSYDHFLIHLFWGSFLFWFVFDFMVLFFFIVGGCIHVRNNSTFFPLKKTDTCNACSIQIMYVKLNYLKKITVRV